MRRCPTEPSSCPDRTGAHTTIQVRRTVCCAHQGSEQERWPISARAYCQKRRSSLASNPTIRVSCHAGVAGSRIHSVGPSGSVQDGERCRWPISISRNTAKAIVAKLPAASAQTDREHDDHQSRDRRRARSSPNSGPMPTGDPGAGVHGGRGIWRPGVPAPTDLLLWPVHHDLRIRHGQEQRHQSQRAGLLLPALWLATQTPFSPRTRRARSSSWTRAASRPLTARGTKHRRRRQLESGGYGWGCLI